MRLLIHFSRYGPYHRARLKSATEALAPLGWDVIGLEIAGTDSTYDWDKTKSEKTDPRVITAFTDRVYEEITAVEYRRVLFPLLDSLAPTVIAIAGWGSTDAQYCLSWCRKNNTRRIVMSETRAADGHRVWWKEWIKRYLISRFDGALVGGKSHRDYLVKLGMCADKIRYGYNVVDNEYFANESLKHRIADSPTPLAYFLSSNRFIDRKNLSRLIEAYSSYIQKSSVNQSPIWPLVLLGDGKQKSSLIVKCHALGLTVIESAPWESPLPPDPSTPSQGTVYFPGFRQIEELPRFYAHANCFIHPALEEPWGLVINEAMACGLPILSSNNVGASEELIDDGVNGWKFDPEDTETLAALMVKISIPDFPLSTFSEASRQILEARCPTKAFGQGLAGLLK